MAYQFVRIETYCPKPMPVPHSDDQFNSIEQVFLEAERDARYSKHVPDPEPPVPIIGFGSMSVSKLRLLHDARRAAIRETVAKPNGTTYQRSLKSDFPTLYTEIHSHPMTASDYKAASKEEKAFVHQWAKLALSDFSKRIPKGVKFAAVLHLDEGHVHFHILAVNIADPKMSANKLHVGKIAAEEWRHRNGRAETLNGLPKPELQARPNKPKKPKPSKTPTTQRNRDATYAATVMVWEADCKRIEAANADAVKRWQMQNNVHLRKLRKERKGKAGDVEAYEAALVGFQDRYYESVGRRCGLLRNGPGTERLPAQQYHARKEQARTMAEHDAALRAQSARQGAERAQITADATGIVEKKAALAHQHAELDAAENALAEREHEIARRDAALRAAEDSWRKKEQVQEEAERTLSQRAVAMKERERALEEKQQNLTMRMEAFHRNVAARQADLDSRERIVTEQQAEVAQAASAMEDLVDQLDAGILTVENGNLRFGRIHAFVGRAIDAPADERSPMQRIVAKFAGLLMRAASTLSGSATPSVEHEERPGL